MCRDSHAGDFVAQSLGQALAEEYRAVHGKPLGQATETCFRAAAREHKQSALCLSGGGIRSAAFCLGVVQALAKGELLAQFDYLSTVSGGGYIGGWLQRQIQASGVEATQKAVGADIPGEPIKALRRYTNYLTPHLGLASADTWAGIVLVLRNMLITWAGLAPLILLTVLAAILYRTALYALSPFAAAAAAAASLGMVGLLAAAFFTCRDIPSHRVTNPPTGNCYLSAASISARIVWPSLAWAILLPVAVAHWLRARIDIPAWNDAWLPGLYALCMALGYLGAMATRRNPRLYRSNIRAWTAATLVCTALLWGGLRLFCAVATEERAEYLAVLGPLLFVVVNMLQATVHVALRPEASFGDLDREWLARVSALKLRLAIGWTVFAFAALSLQRVVFHQAGDTWPSWLIPVITLATGPVGAWLGQRAQSPLESLAKAKGPVLLQRWGLPLLAAIFAAGLVTVLGYGIGAALGQVQLAIWGWEDVPLRLLGLHAVTAVVLLGLWFLMRNINVNRFSLHGVYRNRLVRAFLGTARATARPSPTADPFTEFDPDVNPRMTELVTGTTGRKLFPVINVTLNLPGTSRTDWAERKAAPFTITPLACGSAALGANGAGCFIPSGAYGGDEKESGKPDEPLGMTLGTAITISGAAVSPNWGYHSSPATAFLMTLFNLRLGAWLPNPAVVTSRKVLQRGRPGDSFRPMLADLTGTASDTSPAIYLSDGGHFDNLGLYEMLRRRCELIVVVDAGQDVDCAFADLGAAMRKASIDLQVQLEFKPRLRIQPRSDATAGALGFATASIRYLAPESTGTLLYLKPSFLDTIAQDVRAYGAAHKLFPQESTLEQWFTESQFESYRALGQMQMQALIAGMPAKSSLATFLALARAAEAA